MFIDPGFHPDLFGRDVTLLAVDVHLARDRFSLHEGGFVECYPDLCLHRN